MKKVFALVLFLVLSVVLVVPVTAQVVQSDPCEDRLYYIDDLVAWCVPEGWTSWTHTFDPPHALNQILEDTYDNIDESDLGEFGEELRTAVQVHEAVVDKHIMAAQVFVTEYDYGYETPIAFIEDSYIEFGGINYAFSLSETDGGPIGIVYLESDDDDISRLWLMYPFEDLNRTYTMFFFLSKDAWDSADPLDDINLIAFSLFEAEPLVPVATEEFQ